MELPGLLNMFARSKRPHLLNRRNVLVPLSQFLDLIPGVYCNRNMLCEAIQYKLTYNTTDPVTLECLRDISDDQKVAWWQNNKRYVARKTSMKSLVESGNIMNPWVTDMATGVQQAEDPEGYDRKYNLTRVRQLMHVIQNVTYVEDDEDTPQCVIDFFKFEELGGDLYTTALTNALQTGDLTESFRVFQYGMECAFFQYRNCGDHRTANLISELSALTQQRMFSPPVPHSNALRDIIELFSFVTAFSPDNSNIIIRTIIFNMIDAFRI